MICSKHWFLKCSFPAYACCSFGNAAISASKSFCVISSPATTARMFWLSIVISPLIEMCLMIYYITNPLYFVDLVCEIRYNNVDFKATFQNKDMEVR